MESLLYLLLTFAVILTIMLFNLKVSKEFELLRRVLMSVGKRLEGLFSKVGPSQEAEPVDLINEHIKMQMLGNPLYPFQDSSLRNKLASMESNIIQDVQVGSIMIDKSRLIKLYTDMKLDMNLLKALVKARQILGENKSMANAASEETLMNPFTGQHTMKVLILPRDANEQKIASSRLTLVPPPQNIRNQP